jgi:uncharacterized membrane protein
MTTPIFMLILMTAPYLIVRVLSAATHRDLKARDAAAIGLTALFVFTGIGHFVATESMAMMLPPWVPARVPIIYATGVLEFAIAVGFFRRASRRFTGCIAAAVLVLFLPANIYAALNHVPMGGHAWGPVYLLMRVPLQILILAWVYRFTIRPPNHTRHTGPPLSARP